MLAYQVKTYERFFWKFYKDGQPVVFVEINCDWDGSITYDVWFYPDHSKSVYSVSYDRMCSRLKYLARNV